MPIVNTYKQLGQRILVTSAAMQVYAPMDNNTTTFVKTIFIANVSNGSVTYNLYVNPNGTNSADQYALYKTVSIATGTTNVVTFAGDSGIILVGKNATVIAQSNTANAIVVTLYGFERRET